MGLIKITLLLDRLVMDYVIKSKNLNNTPFLLLHHHEIWQLYVGILDDHTV